VQQHPRRCFIDVLGDRYQRAAGALDGQVDFHVVGAVAGQPIDLVHDDVLGWVLG
jgi:hypothetical protein